MAVALLPASVISRATVLIVEAEEFGSGGKGEHRVASDVVFAATTTVCEFPSALLPSRLTEAIVSYRHIRLSLDQ